MKKILLLLLIALVGFRQSSFAEGTKEISPDSTILAALALMPSALHGPTLSSDSSNKIKFRISNTTERVHYGFHFTDYNGFSLTSTIYITITDPSGATVLGPTALPTSGAGFIRNAREAYVGPNVGSITNGYNPLTFTPATTGEFSITLHRGGTSTTEASSTTWSKAAYFDITVTNTAGTTVYPGRVFCRKWGLVAIDPGTWLPSGTADAAPSFFCYSEDQTLTRLTLNDGFRPVAFSVAMTRYGVVNTSNWLSDRNSINSATSPTIAGGYRLFLNVPDTATLYPITPIPTTPSLATPGVIGCAAPYTVRFIMPSAGDARILFDLNGIPGFQAASADRILEALNVSAGLNTTTWDGLNGLGGAVASGTNLNVSATYQRGRFNLPLYDAEINAAGIKMDAIAPISSPNIRLYWNDALAVPFGGCPNQTQNQTDSGFNNSLLGSITPAHAWSGSGNPLQIIPAPFVGPGPTDQCDDFGNVRAINSWGWALQSTGSTFNIFFGCYTISGSVFNDANALSDNLVNGSSSPVTAIPSGLYAHLVGDGGTTVVQTVSVDPVTGAYTFPNVTSGDYRVVLNNSSTASLATTLPSGWVNTGEKFGPGTGIDSAVNGFLNSVVVTNANVTNANFGIQQIPTATGSTALTRYNPGGTNTVNITSGFVGTDVGGTIDSIRINSFPSNATSITIGSTTYTSGTFPVGGVTFVNGTTVLLDPVDGSVTSVIPFSVKDNGNSFSASAANYNVPFTIVPPVANNIATPRINNSSVATAIPQLQASSPMGTAINSYTIQTIPPASEGVLYYCAVAPTSCTIGALTPITAGTTLTPAQSRSLYFDPAATFTGNSSFTYIATDANSLTSNVANYIIPVYNNPPVTQNVSAAQMPNTNGPTAIPQLVAADKDGSVVNYTVSSIPAASQGILTYCSTGDEPCTGVVTTISGSTVLTAAQMRTLKFDPNPLFTGNYTFNYIATDNNGNTSNTSTYTIPVVAPALVGGNLPPVATNIIAQNINNTSGATNIPNLLGTDPDGTVVNYTIGPSVPNTVTQGTLSYCTTPPATGCGTPVTAGMTLTPAQAATLSFDPVSSFIGTASFTYTATDNNGTPLTSAPATYQIPIVNNPPVANPDRVAPILNTLVTPTLLPSLSGNDYDGSITAYNITSVPVSTSGTLQYCVTPGPGCALTTISAPISGLTPAQVATLRFTPNSGFTGDYVFNFTTVDNNSQVSLPAPFTIPVVSAAVTTGQPPIANSFNAAPIPSSGTSALSTALSGSDPDGTIASYTIRSVVPANEGALTYCITPPATGCGTPLTVGLVLTPAQAATILFTPNTNFTGTATFTYSNTDNSGNTSNIATVTIPVYNVPPVSNNIPNNPIQKTSGATTLNPLASTDADGTVVSYTILTVPSPSEGTLRVCTTAPSTGCTVVNPGDVLTPAQISQLAFTPNSTTVNNLVTFLYATNDNSGNSSNIAAASIPLFDPLILPPVANNISAPRMNNSLGRTAIPQLQASSPSGVAISTFTVQSIPPAAQGTLYYCAAAPAACALGSLTAITAGTAMTPAQSESLYFDPAATFTGNVSFTYNATDANGLVSNTANYNIPVYNNPPVTLNVRTAQMVDTTDRFYLPELIGADIDGNVAQYTVSSIPGTGGVLSYCNTGDIPCTGAFVTISGTTILTPAQALTLEFDPTTGFSGDYVFNFVATDNNGNVSNTSTFTIPIVTASGLGGNLPPVATNITAQNINNTSGATPIPNLLGTDPDGTVTQYTIGPSVPNTVTQGTLSYCTTPPATGCGTPVTAGLTLTPAQAQTLSFDPVASFIGTASFTYTATDNAGTPLTSSPATYNIPVVNNPPVANPDRVAPIANTLTTPTRLSPLTGSDYDGSVVSYNITSLPPSTSGTLQYCATGSLPGCTLSTISGPLSGLTSAQVATLSFTPNSGFAGDYVFNFTVVDNNGQTSVAAPFTVPVTPFDVTPGEPPIAYSFNATPVNSSSVASLPSALTGLDPDGTIASYTITSITPANEGTLTYCATGSLPGCTGSPVTVGLNLTPAQAATIRFTPNANFTGTSTFTYVNFDNLSNLSNTATVTIPVVNNPPVSTNVNNAAISRFSPATTLNPLSSTDADGSVVSYTIHTIPTAEEGVLSVCTSAPSTGCTPVSVGQVLTPAQVAQLAFTPNVWNHSPVITFLFSTVDNSGNQSNIAAANIPMFDAAPLPVELVNFNAQKQQNNALITWKTGVEKPGLVFYLEHSINARNWTPINTQKANGQSDYSFLHKDVVLGNNYYRLKMMDVDGGLLYSPVRVLNFDRTNGYTISIYPNPVSDQLTITTSDASTITQVGIFSNEGKLIQKFDQLQSGSSIDFSHYSSGFYFIRMTDKNGTVQNVKVTKK